MTEQVEATVDRRMADALRASEERYRSVFENTGTATVIMDDDMTISMANSVFEDMTGYRKHEIEGCMKWTTCIAPESRDMMVRYHRQRRRGETAPNQYECRAVDRHGTVREILLTVDMIPGTRQSVASFMDITPLKEAQQALSESERKLATLMRNLPGMAYRRLNDPEWTLEFVSEGCRSLLGYGSEDLLDRRAVAFRDLICPSDRPRVESSIREAVSRRRRFKLTYRIRTRQGREKWVWEQGTGVFGRDGELVALEGFITDFTEHKREEQELRRENTRLRNTMQERYRFGRIVGKSPAMQQVYTLILKAAASEANVIVYGESGTGKELVARAIHDMGSRRSRRFVAVNCGSIPENLMESEFFGYRRGAFTGAVGDNAGYLDRADRGTLFLDELGELGPAMQVKLLRVIEGGGYTPVGDSRLKIPDVRIISATNRDLKTMVRQGRMREDFFYRVHIIPIHLPPLRDRKEDLPLLIDHFLKLFDRGKTASSISGRLLDEFIAYDWPGNVRELQNVLHRYLTLGRVDFEWLNIDAPGRPAAAAEHPAGVGLQAAVNRFEKELILDALMNNRWRRAKTAERLAIDRKTLFRKMKKHEIH